MREYLHRGTFAHLPGEPALDDFGEAPQQSSLLVSSPLLPVLSFSAGRCLGEQRDESKMSGIVNEVGAVQHGPWDLSSAL